MLHHSIIAGTNRAGTTSLFRYLSDHPTVCPSRVKETDFFVKELGMTDEEALSKYRLNFSACLEKARVCLEASPAYMSEGYLVARRIHRILPAARLLFIVREPVGRLVSYFERNKQTQFHRDVGGLELNEFVRLVEIGRESERDEWEDGAQKNAVVQYQRGLYARYIRKYLGLFPKENICIVFFDDLVMDTKSCVERVCQFLDIDRAFYKDYLFRVENKTRRYRLKFLQPFGSRLNLKFETMLNRLPFVRAWFRGLLLAEDKKNKKRKLEEPLRQRLTRVYRAPNIEFAELLAEVYPELSPPSWVFDEDSL